MSSTDNTTASEIRNRRISGIYVNGTAVDGLNFGNMGNLLVERMDTPVARFAVSVSATTAVGQVVFRDCKFGAKVIVNGSIDNLLFQTCTFRRVTRSGSAAMPSGRSASSTARTTASR